MTRVDPGANYLSFFGNLVLLDRFTRTTVKAIPLFGVMTSAAI